MNLGLTSYLDHDQHWPVKTVPTALLSLRSLIFTDNSPSLLLQRDNCPTRYWINTNDACLALASKIFFSVVQPTAKNFVNGWFFNLCFRIFRACPMLIFFGDSSCMRNRESNEELFYELISFRALRHYLRLASARLLLFWISKTLSLKEGNQHGPIRKATPTLFPDLPWSLSILRPLHIRAKSKFE